MSNTRDTILNVAEKLIQDIGVSAMSYQHISDAIGIKKASIHHHFPKKSDLILEVVKRGKDIYGHVYKDIINSDKNAPDKLRDIGKLFEQFLAHDRICHYGMLSAQVNTLTVEAKNELKHAISSLIGAIEKIFEQGIKEHSLQLYATTAESAYSYYASLQGLLIISRVSNNSENFRLSVNNVIKAWEV